MMASGALPAPMEETSVVAGVDIGGSKVAALLADTDGRPVARAVRPMTTPRAAQTEPVVAAIQAALNDAGAGRRLAAIGVGVPGRVDPVHGTVRLAANLGWQDVALAPVLEATFGVPCAVENDVRLAAAGLLEDPVAAGARSLAYVAIGTGIGAGLVLDGRLHRGRRGMAGEIGHTIVEPDGVTCTCGQRGCLETVASGRAIARLASEAVAAGAGGALARHRDLTAREVYDAARAHDPTALAVADRVGRALARAIAGLVVTCDLERVLLGGGVAAAGAVFLGPIDSELDALRAASPLIAELLPAGSVRLLPADFDAVTWGGVAMARQLLAERPNTTGQAEAALGPAAQLEEVIARDALS